MLRTIILLVTTSFLSSALVGQANIIEGYVFETGNRGYLGAVQVDLVSQINGELLDTKFTKSDGSFKFEIHDIVDYKVAVSKKMFEPQEITVLASEIKSNDKTFLSIKMQRAPGYQFEITLAPKRENDEIPIDAVNGALIEVYNNTTRESAMVLDRHPQPHFDVDLIKGNHYTILIRKEGFLAKRMEAFVDVEGCILCFEGVGSVTPGVADNLTAGNQMGVLLANVELEPAFSGKKMEVQDIYYDFGSAKLRKEAYKELDNVAILIKDNPEITIELGSHTDSRGTSEENQILSLKRAKSAVRYLIEEGGVPSANIIARGYGESNIKNGCTNGVECSEAEHQENRRTELKITGILASPPPPVPLAKLKQLENMDEIIAELQSEGQVRLTEGQSFDELIKQSENPSRDIVVEENLENVNEAIDKIFAEADSNITAESEVKKVQNENLGGQSEDLDKDENLVEVEKPNQFSYIDGPKIVIMETNEFLSTEHPIFEKHQQVFQYLLDEKVLYMIGDFNEMNKAEGFLNSTKLMYPDAYILNFDKGTIVK